MQYIHWNWHWWLFVLAVIVCTFIVMQVRAAPAEANLLDADSRAPWRSKADFPGSLLAGAVYASICVGMAGFLY